MIPGLLAFNVYKISYIEKCRLEIFPIQTFKKGLYQLNLKMNPMSYSEYEQTLVFFQELF